MNYQIITDEAKLDEFIAFLPDLEETEVYYLNLFSRNKYVKTSGKDGQIVRFIAKKSEIKQKIQRLECPVGSYSRDGIITPQEALSLYIGLNPRSLVKANKEMLITLAKRIGDGDLDFSPISVATTEIHRAMSRKFFLDFDFDHVEPDAYIPKIQEALPDDAFKILKTKGGFHLIVVLAKVKDIKRNWYQLLATLPDCDVRGSENLTPVPGSYQGGFTPYFI